MVWGMGRRHEEEGEEPMNWPYNGMMPPMQPMYYPMGMPQGQSADARNYERFLKKELKATRLKLEGGKKDEKKDEKKIWWKRFEVGAALFFFSPIIATGWVALLELSWHVVKQLANQ